MKTPEELKLAAYENFITSGVAVYTPPSAMWEWTPTGSWGIRIQTTTAPCWLHRLIQRVCFGIKWRKVK